MASQYMVQLRLIKANQLPKTDTFSKIDPYFKIVIEDHTLKSKGKDDNEDPIYNQVFFPLVRARGPGQLHGKIEFQLYDEDTFSDSHVGTATLDLEQLTIPNTSQNITLPIVCHKEKYAKQGRQSTVTVSIEGIIQSFASLYQMWHKPGKTIADIKKQRLYIPLEAEDSTRLWIGIEYENDGFDIKVFNTQPNSGLFVDMALGNRPKSKIRRRLYPQGTVVAQTPDGSLIAYEEIKMDDIPVATDFNHLQIMVFDSKSLGKTDLDAVVSKHGWSGTLNYHSAKSMLHDIDYDDKEEEIYMEVNKDETVVIVDWDDTNADLKLAVLFSPTTNNKAYDLTIRGQTVKRTSEIFVPPKAAVGKYMISRIYELDDLPYGTMFADIEITNYEISNPRQYTMQALTRIMG